MTAGPGTLRAGFATKDLRSAQLSFALAFLSEWTFVVALAVVAYDDGGATAVGGVGLLRMGPAALLTPLIAAWADHRCREQVLAAVGLVRGSSLAAATLVLVAGGPLWLFYGFAVVATVAFTFFRPAHSALLPCLCREPGELVGANVARGLLDAATIAIGPLVAAGLLALEGPSSAVAAAALMACASAAVAGRVQCEPPPRVHGHARRGALGELRAGLAAITASADARLLVALNMAQTFTRGALLVLTVVFAVDVLHAGDVQIGVLTAAVGVGGVAWTLASRAGANRRLGATFGVGTALWGAPIAALAAAHALAPAVGLLAVVGIGNVLVDIGLFTLLARLTPDEVHARVFGALEALIALSVGLGSIAVPVAIELAGPQATLVIVGALGPVATLLAWPRLCRLDRAMHTRDERIALLRQAPMLAALPAPTIDALADRLQTMSVPAGDAVFRQGEVADRFYVVVAGDADVLRDGRVLCPVQLGGWFGEIGPLTGLPRTATVLARSDLELYAVSYDLFVRAVSGYASSANAAQAVVAGRLTPGVPAVSVGGSGATRHRLTS